MEDEPGLYPASFERPLAAGKPRSVGASDAGTQGEEDEGQGPGPGREVTHSASTDATGFRM